MLDGELTVRPGSVLLAGVVGFAVGEIMATSLVAIVAAATSYPGGVSALASAARDPWWASTLSLVGLWTGFAVAIVGAARFGGLQPWPRQWHLRRGDWRFVVLGGAAQVVIALAYRPFHLRDFNRPVTKLFGATSGAGFVVLALLTTLGAPIVEEWFFRGVIFRGLAALGSRTHREVVVPTAVVLSALLFAAAHGEPAQFVGLAALGVVLAVVAWRTRRLAPSALTHLTFNAVAMVSVVAQRLH